MKFPFRTSAPLLLGALAARNLGKRLRHLSALSTSFSFIGVRLRLSVGLWAEI